MKFFKNLFNPEEVKETIKITNQNKFRQAAQKCGLQCDGTDLWWGTYNPRVQFYYYTPNEYLLARWIGHISRRDVDEFEINSEKDREKAKELVVELQRVFKKKIKLVMVYD